jgi:ribosome-associated protein
LVDKHENDKAIFDLVVAAANAASEKQAIDIVVLNLKEVADFTDYFLICTGVVDVHVKAIHDSIDEALRKLGTKPKHAEGLETSRWILLDYFDFVVCIFQPDARGFYAIEKLWGDAEFVTIKGVNDSK